MKKKRRREEGRKVNNDEGGRNGKDRITGKSKSSRQRREWRKE